MDTKKEIIMAMKEVFSEKGYMASMADVAKIVGIKVPSIYSHYKSKDEIIYLCMQDEFEMVKAYYKSNMVITSEDSIESILEHMFFAYIEYFKDLDKLRFWNNFDLIPQLELRQKGMDAYRVYMSSFLDTIKELFDKGMALGEFDGKSANQMYLMYVVTIQGILRGMLKFEGIGLPTEEYYKNIWNVLRGTFKT
ncbi:MAG TPA: TetR/AcrR family transcriptional regulator [Epulopiscium sp.]|nr:TetR/AcrR family transcriptional regulator [Candidatus Epulonipiscium sp.]